MLYERILAEHKRLEKEINEAQLQLTTCPSGKLVISRHNSYDKWFVSDGKNQTYIPKSNLALAEQLATKEYLSQKLKDLKEEKLSLSMYLRHHKPYPKRADLLLDPSSKYFSLLSPHFTSFAQEIQNWLQFPVPSNPAFPEQLVYKCPSGHIVRSKSETIIATFLYQNKIPFRYEAELRLGNITLYPDFTILHPRTRKIIYWEHFGLMDDPSYRKATSSKLQLYISNGYTPSMNLICTYESKEKPLSIEEIEQLISLHLL